MPGKSCISGNPGTPAYLALPVPLALPAALSLSHHPNIFRISVLLMPMAIMACLVLPWVPWRAWHPSTPRTHGTLATPILPVPWVSRFPLSPSP